MTILNMHTNPVKPNTNTTPNAALMRKANNSQRARSATARNPNSKTTTPTIKSNASTKLIGVPPCSKLLKVSKQSSGGQTKATAHDKKASKAITAADLALPALTKTSIGADSLVHLERTPSEKRKIERTAPTQEILNLWTPTPAPKTLHRITPMAAYDINTKLPFHVLESDQIRMEPLVPSKHLTGFMSLPKESWDVLGDMGPYDTPEAALEDIEEFRKDPRSLLLAVIDKQREGAGLECFAGVYGLVEYNVDEGNILFGLINIHPRYHRTHINSHAMSLTLSFLFDEVKLLRVQYDAVTFNEASIRAALRFGFQAEGVCRNLNGVVPFMKRRDGEEDRESQDLWLSSMTDGEWVGHGRERLRVMCERKAVDTTKLE